MPWPWQGPARRSQSSSSPTAVRNGPSACHPRPATASSSLRHPSAAPQPPHAEVPRAGAAPPAPATPPTPAAVAPEQWLAPSLRSLCCGPCCARAEHPTPLYMLRIAGAGVALQLPPPRHEIQTGPWRPAAMLPAHPAACRRKQPVEQPIMSRSAQRECAAGPCPPHATQKQRCARKQMDSPETSGTPMAVPYSAARRSHHATRPSWPRRNRLAYAGSRS
mmetsp:Transcript_91151/g.244035  ORF Transcript_91151/g.244035 Transcript_91151/m.244035 type:complete len:220 (+) Transcript_91151:902-1561(+)